MSFAQKMVRRCINAARKANHEAIRLKHAGDIEAAQVAREFALMNIGEAKNAKAAARRNTKWSN